MPTFKNVVRAAFDYDAKDKDELSFEEGDVLCVLEAEEAEDESEWMRACLLKDQSKVGLFPNNYVTAMEPLRRMTALYGYEAGEEGELGFQEGEELELLVRMEDDWWLMRRNGNEYGLAPSNYFSGPDSPQQKDIFEDEGGRVDDGRVRWIDVVEIKHVWPGKLTLSKSDKRKGELIIGEDDSFGFVHGSSPKKQQLFTYELWSVESYDRKKKELKIEGLVGEALRLELSKSHAEAFLKCVAEAKEKTEREALEWEQAQIAAYAQQEEAPELPERGASPAVPKFSSPAGAIGAMLQQRLGGSSPISAVSPLATVFKQISKESPSPSPEQQAASGPIVVALYDYVPMEEDELKISEDEQLILVDDTSEDWWLVQRQTGSMRQGLVPSSYLRRQSQTSGLPHPRTPYEQAFGIQDDQEETQEEDTRGLIQPKSPLSQGSAGSRAHSPALSAAFLDEIKHKIKARSPVPLPVDDDTDEQVDEESQVAEQSEVVVSSSEEDFVVVPSTVPAPPALPKFLKASQEEIPTVKAPQEDIAQLVEESSKVAVKVEAPKPAEQEPKPQEKVPPLQAIPRKSFLEAEKEGPKEVVKAESKKAGPTVTIPMPKLKPVLKEDNGSSLSALSNMLLRKQEDVRVGQIRMPEVPKAAPLAEEKPNPWKKISMKTVAEKPQPEAVKPTIVPKAEPVPSKFKPVTKPVNSESRLWTSKNGQFQVEAKYLSYHSGKVSLLKINGSRVDVPIDQLSDRDKQYVYRSEGIPWDQAGPKQDYKVGNLDWLAFFSDAGLDMAKARVFAQACLEKRIGEPFLLSTSFSRQFLLGVLHMSDADALEVLRYSSALQKRHSRQLEERKNLEKIEQLKHELATKPMAPKPPQRRPSEVFAEIDIGQLNLGPQSQQQYMSPPVVHYSPPLQQSRSIKDIPAMQPVPKNGVKPTVFTNTTILNLPPTQVPAQMPFQQQQFSPMTQSMPHAQPVQQMQPMQQGVLPNLAPPKAYVPPPPKPTQQTIYNVQTGQYVPMPNAAPYPLGTTQMRTEYYGYNAGQNAYMQPQMQPMPMQPPPMQQQMYNLHPNLPYTQPMQPVMQTIPEIPPSQSSQRASAGDKYSIFRYVNPAPPPTSQPGAKPNGCDQTYHQS